MGFGWAVLIVLFGNAFAGFGFATSVINAVMAVAVGFIGAVAFVNWVPSPASGLIASFMPILTIAAFWKKELGEPGDPGSGFDFSFIKGYMVRFGISIALFGIVVGASRVVCANKLLSSPNIEVELVLLAGCIVSLIVFLVAIIASKRETFWDSLLRYTMPVITLGIACLGAITSRYELLASFFAILGFVCMVALLWVFLASMARNLNGSSIFVFGMGYGIMQGASILGSAIANVFFSASPVDVVAMQNVLMKLSLVLLPVLGCAYAVMPRYREMRRILSSVLSGMMAKGARTEAPSPVSATAADAGPGGNGAVSMEEGAPLAPDDGLGAPIQEVPAEATGAFEASGAELVGSDGAATEASEFEGARSEELQARDAEPDDGQAGETEAESEPKRDEKGSFVRRCDEICSSYGLSAREKEVFFLLAKGHNAAFITDQLCISRSTAKTHINHIYKKLGIHTQQELLRMVEDRKRGPGYSPMRGPSFGSMGAAVSPENYDELIERALETKAHHDAEMSSRAKGSRN